MTDVHILVIDPAKRSFQIKDRCSKHYRISIDQLSWLAGRVEGLGQVVHMICSERLEVLKRSAAA